MPRPTRPGRLGPDRSTPHSTLCRGSWACRTRVGWGACSPSWPEIVGAGMAEHVRPVRLDTDSLVVTVDHPAWATQVRRMGDSCSTGWPRRPGRPAGSSRGPGPALTGSGRPRPSVRGGTPEGYTGALESGDCHRLRNALSAPPTTSPAGSRPVTRCWKGRACGAEK